MQISPFVPAAGLLLIIANILLAALRPFWSPTVMGIQLFIGGMTTILIAVLDLLNPIGIPAYERVILFVAGCINCTLGYFMVLREMRRR